MATMWKRAMLYLGLGPDEQYDDYDAGDELAPVGTAPVLPPPAPTPGLATGARYAMPPDVDSGGSGAVRTISSQGGDGPTVLPRPRSGVVRPLQATAAAKPVTIAPAGFNDAQEIGDKYKAGQPVIVNTQHLDTDLRRRLIDFASGLCYGLGGQMERVANQVYLLTPSNVEVSAEDRRRLQERGLYQA